MPSNPTTLSTTARQAVDRQDWATVDAAAHAILQQDNDSAEGHFLAGLVAKAARKPKVATDAFARALAIDPNRYDAAIELAGQHSVARRNGEAAALLERYQSKLGNSPRYLDMAGTIYTEIGLPESAYPLYVKANELQPGIDLFQSNLASCGVHCGKIEESRKLYEALLERFPKHQRNHYRLARLAKATDDRHVRQMRYILESGKLPPDQNVFLYYALGKELEDLERWDESFRYLKMGGDAVTSVAQYDIQEDFELIDTIIEVCDSKWLSQRSGKIETTVTGKTPFFIVGLPRTGTTLTERIVSSHSDVSSLGETQFVQMIIRRESGVKSIDPINPAMIRAAATRNIELIANGYLDAVNYRLGSEPMFIDKLPLNFLHLGFIAKAFPDARIVLLNRHPLDACFAMYKQVFTWPYKFSYTLDGLARYYPAYERLKQHWRDLLGPRLVEVHYETLVSQQESETRRLLDRLGLEFQQACLDFDKNKTASATASSVQVREKIHTRSVNRWRYYEKHLEPLWRQLEASGISLES